MDNIDFIHNSPAKKFIYTFKQFAKTARHHYGNSASSYLKFVYYSGIRLNLFFVYENDLTRHLPPLDLEPGITVIKPSLAELVTIRQNKDLPREFFYDKLLNVSHCYLAYYENKLAYIHWVFFKGDYSRFLILGDEVAELNYNTTLPKFRGRRLSAKMMAYICRDLQQQGFRKVMGVIHESNIASIKCILEAGFVEVAQIRTLGPFHKKYSVWP